MSPLVTNSLMSLVLMFLGTGNLKSFFGGLSITNEHLENLFFTFKAIFRSEPRCFKFVFERENGSRVAKFILMTEVWPCMLYNNLFWYFAMFLSLQAVGLYPTNSSSVNRFILQDCRANVLIVEEEKGVNKILAMKNELPDLKKIIQVFSHLILAWPWLIQVFFLILS